MSWRLLVWRTFVVASWGGWLVWGVALWRDWEATDLIGFTAGGALALIGILAARRRDGTSPTAGRRSRDPG